MLKYSKDGISVFTVLDRRRVKTNGMYPVKVEVVYRRQQKYYPTGIDMTPQQWESASSTRENSEAEQRIETSFHNVRSAVETLADRGIFSMMTLSLRLGQGSEVTVNSALTQMMERFRKEGRVNSYYRCRSTLRAFEKFAGDKVLFRDVTEGWLYDCETFWRKEGMACTTVSIYMRTLKCVFNEAVKRGYVKESSSPFGRGKYSAPRGVDRKLALSKSDIKKIIEFKGTRKQEQYRDLWLFSYLCNGINFRDMLFLKYGNVSNGEITFVRSKTMHAYGHSKVIHAVLSPQMKDIIERWGNPNDGNPDTYIFPYAVEAKDSFSAAFLVRKVIYLCNLSLRKIAKELGIPAFTTYSARHSFATILQRSGTSLSFISESLGHSSLAVTEHYLAGFDHEDRLKYSAALTDFR